MTERYMIKVPAASLLKVIRRLDFNADMSLQEFSSALDDLRSAFHPDEIAYGELINYGGKYEAKPLDDAGGIPVVEIVFNDGVKVEGKDVDQIMADQAWWNEALAPYELQVHGWTYRHTASVSIAGTTVQLNAKMRNFLLEAAKKIYKRAEEDFAIEIGG